MRLIDADALKIDIMCVYGSNPQYINWLNHAPTVDAVPVVRCKDCKHMGDVYLVRLPWLEQKEHRCRYWEHPTTPDEYCSRAKRREE